MFSSSEESVDEEAEKLAREEEKKKKKEKEAPVVLYDYGFSRNYAHNVGLFKSHVFRDSLMQEKENNYITYKCFHENIMPHSFGRKSWVDFVEYELSDTECQYTVFDLEFCLDPKARLGSKKRRMKHSHVLLTWVPKKALPLDRRLYMMQSKEFRRQFGPAGSWINVALTCTTKEVSRGARARNITLAPMCVFYCALHSFYFFTKAHDIHIYNIYRPTHLEIPT